MSNYYDYREVKVMIAHKLMSMEAGKYTATKKIKATICLIIGIPPIGME